MDQATLWAILRHLRSDEELQFMRKLYVTASERRLPDSFPGASQEDAENEGRTSMQ